MYDAALVLEGGALRCLFTAGVLDVFLENKIDLSYVIGVSAGSLSGINYVAKQIGRTARVNIDFVNDKRYLGFTSLVRTRSIFNFDFLFGEISDTLVPLDKEAFYASEQRYIAVATNCVTGEEEYFERDCDVDAMLAARASCSMPLFSRMVPIKDSVYLDGGVAMPIAYQRAIEDGNEKLVLVLTRQEGYRKPEQPHALLKAYERAYRKYPELVKKLKAMPEHYNQMQEEIEKLEKEGKVFIIRPKDPVEVSRIEKDVTKLEALYQIGREIATESLPGLIRYLES